MATDNDGMLALVEAAARVVGIEIEPQWKAGVAGHLAIIMANAELVAEFDDAATAEPAPVFAVS